ncbi:MAG: RiPP maturation radical SAM C-methyltransferase [Jatrophihabitantaceae bacterium]
MRIVLVNMPFADWHRPSVALSQLASHLKSTFGDSIEVEVCYVNVDFALLFGPAEYQEFVNNVGHGTTGVGEWLFRRIAFPDAPDNADEYFRRYFGDESHASFRAQLLSVRDRLDDFCERILTEYRLTEADLVGFTSMFSQNLPSIAMARLIKSRSPEVITAMGGCNCEAPMGTVLAEHIDCLDYIFSGPGLHTFPEFVQALLDGKPELADNIPGVLSKRNIDIPKFRRGVGRERNIDDYVKPEYHSFVDKFSQCREDLRALGGDVEPILYFETSRGCWWGERSHCTFCGLNGLDMAYRSMKAELAVEQLEWLFEFHPWCRNFHGTDNILPRNYVRDVFSKLKPPKDALIFYEIKVPVSDHDMKVLAEVGVREVQPGIEALSTSTLKLMAKGTTSFLNLQFLRSCLKHGINPLWNLLLGFPGEEVSTYEKYARELPTLTHLPPPEGSFLVRFDRYSPYYTRSAEFGLDLQPMDFYELVYAGIPKSALKDLAYHFVDTNLSPYQVHSVEWLGELQRLTAQWRAAWESGTPPELAMYTDSDGDWGVSDTRFGDRRWTLVDPDELRMLNRLTSPVQVAKLAKDLDLEQARVDEILAAFAERHWLFTEDESVYSLVTGTPGQAKERELLSLTPVAAN